MAKVTGALFSLHASGTLGGAITFVCGQFARRHENTAGKDKKGNPVQMAKFKAGAQKWQTLSDEIQATWQAFYKALLASPVCINVTYDLSGYDIWMLYWLKFGENGWAQYPLPGPEPPKKPK